MQLLNECELDELYHTVEKLEREVIELTGENRILTLKLVRIGEVLRCN